MKYIQKVVLEKHNGNKGPAALEELGISLSRRKSTTRSTNSSKLIGQVWVGTEGFHGLAGSDQVDRAG